MVTIHVDKKVEKLGDIYKIIILECVPYWLYHSKKLMCAENNVIQDMLQNV